MHKTLNAQNSLNELAYLGKLYEILRIKKKHEKYRLNTKQCCRCN